MRYWRIVALAPVLGCLLVVRFQTQSAWGSSSHAVPVPHYHSVPCAQATPDSVTATWQIVRLGAISSHTGRATRHVTSGHRTIQNRGVAASLYHQICATILIKYDHPAPIACPAATGSATYHLAFHQRSRVLLRVTENDEGCRFVWIEGHRNLGYSFGVLYLPPNMPSVRIG